MPGHASNAALATAGFFNAQFLFASLFWSSVGVGYWIYGKRQSAMSAMLGGVAMIAVAYFIASAVWMTLVCLGIAAAVYWLLKHGD